MKCGDLAKELGVTAMHVGRIKNKIDPNSGSDLSPELARKIRDVIEDVAKETKASIAEALEPVFVKAQICHPGRNRHVLIRLEDRRVVPALMPDKNNGHLVGGRYDFEEVDYQDKKYYRHKTLAGREFNVSHTRI